MDVELLRWVKFGLSSGHSISHAGNSQMVMIGCSLAKQLSAMHEKDLSVAFCVCLLNVIELFGYRTICFKLIYSQDYVCC